MMEGDVLWSGMGWLIPLAVVASSVLGGIALIVRILMRRLLLEFDRRLERIDEVAEEQIRLDAEFRRFLAELPLHYQRREDAIREFTVVHAKLDRIIVLMIELERNKR